MTFKLGPASLMRLQGIHPDLVKVVERAIQLTTQDFSVTCGARTLAEQKELYAQGRTKLLGRITMPIIDALFWWQGPNHCYHAYRKEIERKQYPAEYRSVQ